MQKFYILFFIQVQCSDCGLRCGWADKYNGSYTECDDSELEKYFKDAQYKDQDVSGKEVFKEHWEMILEVEALLCVQESFLESYQPELEPRKSAVIWKFRSFVM